VAATAVPYRTTYTVRQPDKAGEHGGDMEGTTHAATGFLLGLGVSLLSQAGAHHPLPVSDSLGRDLLFGTVVAGFALFPDADHPKASFAYAAGGLSHGISHLIAVLSGGHRQGMHSLAGIAGAALATAACASWFPNRWALTGLGIMMAICIAAGLRATGFIRKPFEACIAGGAMAGASVYFIRADLWWLVALGMALHVFEDMFTGHGVALAWPLTSRRFGGDRRQPASRRPASAGPRARRPASPRPEPGPAPRVRKGPSKPMCLQCLLGECGECLDRGCGCPQLVHPERPKRRTRTGTVPSTVVYDEPPDIPF